MADTNTKTDAYRFTRIYNGLKTLAEECNAAGLGLLAAVLMTIADELAKKHQEIVKEAHPDAD